jgi:hypothetical protein
MKLVKGLIFLTFCLLMMTCFLWKGDLEIDIGDYDNQLAAWNNQNMLDYQIEITYFTNSGEWDYVVINVKNGIPESIVPPEWPSKSLVTIPEFYSYIKKVEKRMRNNYKKDNTYNYILMVSYDTEYYYPNYIRESSYPQVGNSPGSGVSETWEITLTPAGGE